jgi:urease accessory protein
VTWAAHLVTTGAGAFYDGAAHFFVSFEELLPVVALSLFAGLRGPRAGRWAAALLAAAWIAGAGIGFAAPLAAPPPLATTLLLLIPGAFVAWDRDLPLAAVAVSAAAAGGWIGFTNGSAMAAAELGWRGAVGAAGAALVVAILIAAFTSTRRGGWTRIAVRVAGSWLAALGLLALGWALK